MSATGKVSGKASYIQVTNTKIPITKYEKTGKRENAKSTDSTSYDAATDMLWPEQIPVSVTNQLKIDGFYNTTLVKPNILTTFYSGASAVYIELGIKAGTMMGYGYYDLSGFSASDPVDGIVTYNVTADLNGVYYSYN